MKYGRIGTVSHGTLRDEDLLESFSSELDSLLRKQSRRFKRASYRKLIREAQTMLRQDELPDDASELVNDLQDALGDFAPAYCYFGTNEGDGSDFGFWVTDPRESEFDGLVVDDTSEVPADYRGEVLHISDHGNMTLYMQTARDKRREIWGVV